MKLRNLMIVVDDCAAAKEYYVNVFGLAVVTEVENNVILTEGLVLQNRSVWEEVMPSKVIAKNNMTELYFEENDIKAFTQKLLRLYPDTQMVTPLYEYPWGKKIVRFYDPFGNLIEVGTR